MASFTSSTNVRYGKKTDGAASTPRKKNTRFRSSNLGADRFARGQWSAANAQLKTFLDRGLWEDEENDSIGLGLEYTKELRDILKLFQTIQFPTKAVSKSDCSKTVNAFCTAFARVESMGRQGGGGLKVFKDLCEGKNNIETMSMLKNELCSFIELLTLQQDVEYGASDLMALLEFSIAHMTSSQSVNAVKLLAAILKDHSSRCTTHFPPIVDGLLALGGNTQGTVEGQWGKPSVEMTKALLFCMGNLCGGSSSLVYTSASLGGPAEGGGLGTSTALRGGLKAAQAERMLHFAYKVVRAQHDALSGNGVLSTSSAVGGKSTVPTEAAIGQCQPDILSASLRTLASMMFGLPSILQSFPDTKEMTVMLHEMLRFEGVKAKRKPNSTEMQSTTEAMSSASLDAPSTLQPKQATAAGSWRSSSRVVVNSDSDTCASDQDTDGNDMYSASQSHRVSVRLHALSALLAICRAEPTHLLSRWVFFLPESSRVWSDRNGEEVGKSARRKGRYRSLVEVMLHERSWRLRSAAACLIISMFEAAPLEEWLPKSQIIAKNSSSPVRAAKATRSSFTPMPERYAITVETLHSALYTALKKETHAAVLTQLLRCIATVFRSVPYNQIDVHVQATVHTLLLCMVRIAMGAQSAPDQVLRSVAFTTIGAAVSTKAPLGKIDMMLRKQTPVTLEPSMAAGEMTPVPVSAKEAVAPSPKIESDFSEPKLSTLETMVSGGGTTKGKRKAWVPPHLRPATASKPASRAKFEESESVVLALLKGQSRDPNALLTLAKMAKNYPIAVGSWWNDGVRRAAIEGFASREHRVREYAIKLLDALMKSNIRLPGLEAIIIGQVTHALADTNNAVRTSALQLVQGLGPSEWEAFPVTVQSDIIKLVSASFKDNAPKVRTAAAYVAGSFVMHPCFQTKAILATFSNNILSLLKTEDTLVVVSRCAWALANLCICIHQLVQTDCHEPYDVPKQISHAVISLAQNYEDQSQTQDKIRTSSIRALGSLGQFWASAALSTTEEANEFQTSMSRKGKRKQNMERAKHGATQDERIMLESVARTLLKHLDKGSAKTIWNGCHAMGGIFETACNTCEAGFIVKQDWHDEALAMLIVCLESANFKVRINAVAALRMLKTKDEFLTDGQRLDTRLAVAQCLENVNADTEFSQYQYRETLIQECTATLAHLDGMQETEDEF